MTLPDELDELKAAMDAATPRPDPDRRAETLRLASEYYDRLQESPDAARPTPATARNGLLTGVRAMLATLSTRGGLAATTALVACGLLILTPQGQELLRPALPGSVTDVTEVDGEGPTGAVAEIVAAPEEEEAVAATVAQDAPEAELEPRLQRRAGPATAEEAPPMVEMAPMADAADTFMAEPSALPPPMPSLAAPGDDLALAPPAGTEAFPDVEPSSLKIAAEEPVSTFSIDVDTASWAVVRSSLTRGQLPPRDAVRIEEMVNYFPYDYPAPAAGEAPFRATLGVMDSPWAEGRQLVHIGLQGALPPVEARPPLNLVFLVDTSGSMDAPDKLGLLKQSFRLMLSELRPQDEIAIVAYAGSAGEVLAPTPAGERATILAALERLAAGGSTNGAGGLEQAYATAEAMTEDGEVSRILLATDGDFNVGLSDPSALEDFIADKRDSGTYLSVLGFGRGNLDDATMQALAQNGNGTAAYIDTLHEAQKVLVDQLTGALFPIADDVKVQVEFNPAAVAEYRLIGYETRALRREDFNNDAVDAGELGAGHQVTALYEITPTGSGARLTDPLRYGEAEAAAGPADELAFLRLRYKAPGEETSELVEQSIRADAAAIDEARFAAAVAGFGELLRGSDYLGDWRYGDAIALASEHRGSDPYGYRAEAVRLMRLAETLAR
ncbi:Putative membrane protein with von Willebrand (VWA) domain [Oceanicola granulosus HTCC2516]|uniref:Putative membrane protein with von Willebrand (VWA) domain n=1 Tax=Oceanicola granulosus (strain ATCC BAA-861 / DSM 15982 / KCTC 12143 / HTCC2516) TaxID=314256 RepID=Q2CFQ6_OCEGH|nr:VWA domain-containing protein [Oceanicola granulosus]EAR51426.1 Putative membrane protein with von Willebrand (VWA) domain [Oceanicola granulosus HTCC2516]